MTDETEVEEDIEVDELDVAEPELLSSTMESADLGKTIVIPAKADIKIEEAPPDPPTIPADPPAREGEPPRPLSAPPISSNPPRGSVPPQSKNPTPSAGLLRPSQPPSGPPRSGVPRPRSVPPSKLPPLSKPPSVPPPRPLAPPPRSRIATISPTNEDPKSAIPKPSRPPSPGEERPRGASTPPTTRRTSRPPPGSSSPPEASEEALEASGPSTSSGPPRRSSAPPPGGKLRKALEAPTAPMIPRPDDEDDEMDRPTLVHNPDADPSIEAAIARARAAAALERAGISTFEDDEVDGLDLAKTVKLTRRKEPSLPPRIDESELEDDDGPPKIPSLGADDDVPAARDSKPKRRRSRKGKKRRAVIIPDDSVPATPTPAAVEAARGAFESIDEELEELPDPLESEPGEIPQPEEEEEDRIHTRQSAPGIFTDDSAIAVLRPIQIVSDLPAVESTVTITEDVEEIEPEPDSEPHPPKPPPPRAAMTSVDDIVEIVPEDIAIPPISADAAGDIASGDFDSKRRPPPPPPLAKGAEAAIDDAVAIAEARAREAELRAREAEAKAKAAAAKAEAARSRPPAAPWWREVFQNDLIRTFDNPKKRDVERETDFIIKTLALEPGARVLDLACGTGVHAVELSSRGYQVVGVDLSPTMLELASAYNKQRSTSVSFIEGDMRQLSLEGVFDGIYCWGASFGYFDESHNGEVIERVARALRPGGTFALDVPNRDFVAPRAPTMAWFEKPGVVCMDEMRFDFYSSRMITKRMILFDTGKSREVEMSIRLYSLTELGRMFHKAGFKVLEVSGHRAHRGAYFGAESPRIMITGRRRDEPES
ncbi:MAG: methyltransferase domain-containing protein [Polyangiaceae bacterium]